MRRFACIEFVQDITEVPIKFNVLKKGPSFIIDWYIKKFNPFVIEKQELLGVEGLTVKLPMTAAAAKNEPEFFQDIAERTLTSLQDYGVDIVLPPPGRPDFPRELLRVADGRNIFPFLVMRVIMKALKMLHKDIKTAELIILVGAKDLTMSLIDNIYPYVNYLTVMTAEEEDGTEYTEQLEAKAKEIFNDCGLNVQVTGFNKSLLTGADVVVNTRDDNHRYDFYYKRGAVYLDLSRSEATELASKREDMLIIDSLRVRAGAPVLSLDRLECPFYIMSKEYRTMLNRGYSLRLMESAAEGLARLEPELTSLCLHGGVLNSTSLTRTLQKAGVIH